LIFTFQENFQVSFFVLVVAPTNCVSRGHNKPMNITTGRPFFYFQTFFWLPSLSLNVKFFTPNIHTVVAQRFISVSAKTEPAVELQSDETLFGRGDFTFSHLFKMTTL
jgi:hypothetical protein